MLATWKQQGKTVVSCQAFGMQSGNDEYSPVCLYQQLSSVVAEESSLSVVYGEHGPKMRYDVVSFSSCCTNGIVHLRDSWRLPGPFHTHGLTCFPRDISWPGWKRWEAVLALSIISCWKWEWASPPHPQPLCEWKRIKTDWSKVKKRWSLGEGNTLCLSILTDQ